MSVRNERYALKFSVDFTSETGLLLRSGKEGEFSDSAIERADGKLHINGYVWASLIRRALARCVSGAGYASAWGRYDKESMKISPLWTEAALLDERDFEAVINPGNRIDREWGTVIDNALYWDELAIIHAPLVCQGTVFCTSEKSASLIQAALTDAFWVISQGIETIGGGWSYGFGRLKLQQRRFSVLDLTSDAGRKALFDQSFDAWTPDKNVENPVIAAGKGWTALEVNAAIADGQLLAIHTDVPPMTEILPFELPDSFVFTRPVRKAGKREEIPVITGKAFRQSILSREIERKQRSTGGKACLDTADRNRDAVVKDTAGKRHCRCPRCLWFGDSDVAGIVSVGDALANGYETEVLHRVQLCEHSMQNIQLFSGEYLKKGTFTFRVLIDNARPDTDHAGCVRAVTSLLQEMRPGNGPDGWYRLGATSTCTGQLTIVEEIKEQTHG